MKISDLQIEPSRAVDPVTVAALARSIDEVGLLNPITVDAAGNVIAGIHRIRACQQLGLEEIEVNVVDLDEVGIELATLDENLCRNDGTALERAEALERRQVLYEQLHPETRRGGDRRSNRHNGALKSPPFVDDAAAKTQESPRSIQRHTRTARDLDPEAKEVIRKGPIADSITELELLAKQAPAEQRKIAARATAAGETVKQAIKSLHRQEQIEQVKAYVPPVGEFPLISADPAWPYEDQLDGSEAVRGGTPYPQASIAAICAQPPPATKDAVLFLWCTNQHLIDLEAPVQQVLQAWGFTPKALLTWKKPRMGLGRYVRNITEQCVIAIRGKPVLDLPSATSWLEAPAGAHSVKPDEFYELAARLCPATPRLEMNARKPRAGWVTSGAELGESNEEASGELAAGEAGDGDDHHRKAEGLRAGGERGSDSLPRGEPSSRSADGLRAPRKPPRRAHGLSSERDQLLLGSDVEEPESPFLRGNWRMSSARVPKAHAFVENEPGVGLCGALLGKAGDIPGSMDKACARCVEIRGDIDAGLHPMPDPEPASEPVGQWCVAAKGVAHLVKNGAERTACGKSADGLVAVAFPVKRCALCEKSAEVTARSLAEPHQVDLDEAIAAAQDAELAPSKVLGPGKRKSRYVNFNDAIAKVMAAKAEPELVAKVYDHEGAVGGVYVEDGKRCGVRPSKDGDPCFHEQGHPKQHSNGNITWSDRKPKSGKKAR